eukprot:scaffold34552_cov90-Isochrysis_galbana.AAC.2
MDALTAHASTPPSAARRPTSTDALPARPSAALSPARSAAPSSPPVSLLSLAPSPTASAHTHRGPAGRAWQSGSASARRKAGAPSWSSTAKRRGGAADEASAAVHCSAAPPA